MQSLWLTHVAGLLEPVEGQRLSWPTLGISLSGFEVADRAHILSAALDASLSERPPLVLIAGPKSPDLVTLVFACLMADLPYVVVDHSMTLQRFRRVFPGDTRPLVLAVGSEGSAFALRMGLPSRLIEGTNVKSGPGTGSASIPDSWRSELAQCAYGVLTSGSSGTPRVALISHEALAFFLDWVPGALELVHRDIAASVSPIHFDNFVFDLLGVRASGASSFFLADGDLAEPSRMLRTLRESGCTYWYSTPSVLVYLKHLKLIDKRVFPEVRTIAFGGESMPVKTLREIREALGPEVAFLNVYGPSECACMCSAHSVSEGELDASNHLPPLGKIAPQFAYDIKTDDSDCGELILKGPQVGLGYLGRSQDPMSPFGTEHCGPETWRTYNTGDLVYKGSDGLLYFHGRRDTQVKVRGVRLDLAEVEAAAMEIPGVAEACAVLQDAGLFTAHVVLHVSGSAELSDIQNTLRNELPKEMVPRLTRIWAYLPRNANGKVDRAFLQES